MATASVTNTFVNETPADADEVNTNFTEVVSFMNNNVIHRDGSKAFTSSVDAGSNRVINVSTPTASTDAANKAYVDSYTPPGVVSMYAGSTAPTGHLMCDGSAVSRTTYAALFAVVGTTYGAGDGSTTFNVPDIRNRFPVGKGAGTWSDALAETGGSTDAVVVTHTHTVTGTTNEDTHNHSGTTSTDGSHTHTTSDTGGVYSAMKSGASYTLAGGATRTDQDLNGLTTGSGGSHNHTVTVSNDTHSHTTSGTAAAPAGAVAGTNANLPPYITLNFIIKT